MKLELTQRSEAPSRGWQHLGMTQDNRLCLVAEDLYQDFADACRTVTQKIDGGKLKHPKLRSGFLRV
jgi:hypothetical protein